jgi:hypothetical protein
VEAITTICQPTRGTFVASALAPIDHQDLVTAWRDSRGLSGAHRATAAEAVKQIEAEEQAAKEPTQP